MFQGWANVCNVGPTLKIIDNSNTVKKIIQSIQYWTGSKYSSFKTVNIMWMRSHGSQDGPILLSLDPLIPGRQRVSSSLAKGTAGTSQTAPALYTHMNLHEVCISASTSSTHVDREYHTADASIHMWATWSDILHKEPGTWCDTGSKYCAVCQVWVL